MNLMLQRLRGASTGGTPTGLHGTNIVGDEGAARQPDAVDRPENTVTATTDLAFAVTVEDSRRRAGGQHPGDADARRRPRRQADRQDEEDRR